jgi:hypothetical protein
MEKHYLAKLDSISRTTEGLVLTCRTKKEGGGKGYSGSTKVKLSFYQGNLFRLTMSPKGPDKHMASAMVDHRKLVRSRVKPSVSAGKKEIIEIGRAHV